jgi:hypothetical protein
MVFKFAFRRVEGIPQYRADVFVLAAEVSLAIDDNHSSWQDKLDLHCIMGSIPTASVGRLHDDTAPDNPFRKLLKTGRLLPHFLFHVPLVGRHISKGNLQWYFHMYLLLASCYQGKGEPSILE